MDHERYPYYFSDPAAQPEEFDVGAALASVGTGIWNVMSRVASFLVGAHKTAR